MGQKEPALGSIIDKLLVDSIKDIKLASKGPVPLRVHETIEALWPGKVLKPLVVEYDHNNGDKHTWWFIIHLPGHITFEQFRAKEENFAGVGCSAYIRRHGDYTVMLTVSDFKLKTKYPYAINPKDYETFFIPEIIGESSSGLISEDVAFFPHFAILGATGNGKTTAIESFIYTQLICQGNPWSKSIIFLLDYKQAGFEHFKDYCIIVHDIPSGKVILKLIEAENNRRKGIRAKYNTRDWDGVIKKNPNLPWIILIVDELGEMKDKESQLIMNTLGSQGRAQGIRIVAGTQSPRWDLWSETNIKGVLQHFEKRLVFSLPDMDSSFVALGKGNAHAATLDDIPGRAIFHKGRDFKTVQTLYFPDPEKDPREFNRLMDRLKQTGVKTVRREVYGYLNQGHELSQMRLPRQSNFGIPARAESIIELTDIFPFI